MEQAKRSQRPQINDNLAFILGSTAAAHSLKEATEEQEPYPVEELVLPTPSE